MGGGQIVAKLTDDVMGRTAHHVVAPAFAGAFGTAAMGAFEGWSQTGQAERHSRRQSRRQGKHCKPSERLAPTAPSLG